MDKEMFDTLLAAMVDVKNDFKAINEKLDLMAEDIADIKSDIQIITGTQEKQERRIKKLERAIIQ